MLSLSLVAATALLVAINVLTGMRNVTTKDIEKAIGREIGEGGSISIYNVIDITAHPENTDNYQVAGFLHRGRELGFAMFSIKDRAYRVVQINALQLSRIMPEKYSDTYLSQVICVDSSYAVVLCRNEKVAEIEVTWTFDNEAHLSKSFSVVQTPSISLIKNPDVKSYRTEFKFLDSTGNVLNG